ncbi:MAG: hypothetical protein KUG78_04035 [Kangiellaceae bacterium]|nr:hypothetical protein [Kangiellaceae bacterium]
MNSNKFTEWSNLIANIGIAIGLFLVILQMNQNEKLVQIQIKNQYAESYIAAETTFAGENMPLVWQKSAEEPQSLTLAEMRIMESQTFAILLRWINLYNLAESGILSDDEWRKEVSLDVGFYFNTPYGRAWWEYHSRDGGLDEEILPIEMKKLIDGRLIALKNTNSLSSFQNIKEILVKNMAKD